MHVLRFILFCFVYLIWMIGAFLVLAKAGLEIRFNRSFVNGELIIFLSIGGMVAFIYLLSGFFSLPLTLVLLLASQLGFGISAILWTLAGSTEAKWAERTASVSTELRILHPKTQAAIGMASGIILLGYPVAAGVLYFHHPLSSHELTILTIQLTLLYTVLSSLIAMLPLLIGLLSSADLDEDTRVRVLAGQLGGLVPNALLFALLYWTLPLGRATDTEFAFGTVSLRVSPALMLILFAYFVFLVLLPYIIGAKRGRQKRARLLQKRDDLLKDLIQTLREPIGLNHAARVADLQTRLATEGKTFAQTDPTVAWSLRMLPPDQAQKFSDAFQEPVLQAFQDTRDADERFSYMDWLAGFYAKAGEIAAELGKSTSADESNKIAASWADAFHDQRDEVQDQIKRNEEKWPAGVVVAAWTASALISPALDSIGKAIAGSLPHLG